MTSVRAFCSVPPGTTRQTVVCWSKLAATRCRKSKTLGIVAPLLIIRKKGRRKPQMKLIIAIIQPDKLELVKEALNEVEVVRLTVLDCQGFGRQKGQTGVYRGHEFSVNLLRKVQLQIAVNDEFVKPTVDAILKGGRTGEKGQIGDGKIFVLPMDDCIRIRTGERGSEAI